MIIVFYIVLLVVLVLFIIGVLSAIDIHKQRKSGVIPFVETRSSKTDRTVEYYYHLYYNLVYQKLFYLRENKQFHRHYTRKHLMTILVEEDKRIMKLRRRIDREIYYRALGDGFKNNIAAIEQACRSFRIADSDYTYLVIVPELLVDFENELNEIFV